MIGSLIVGMVAALLGTSCVAAGVAISVVEALRPREAGTAAFPSFGDVSKLGKVVAEILEQFAKLRPAAQLLVVGLALFGVGTWLLASRPF